MRIDSTYFHDSTFLGLAQSVNGIAPSLTTAESKKVDYFINRYEPAFLRLILGNDLYDDYKINYASDKWKDFDALIIDSTLKDSCISDYIFTKIYADMNSSAGTVTSQGKSNSSVVVSPMTRIAPVWNRLIDRLKEVFTYLEENSETICGDYQYNYEGWSEFVMLSPEGKMLGNYVTGCF